MTATRTGKGDDIPLELRWFIDHAEEKGGLKQVWSTKYEERVGSLEEAIKDYDLGIEPEQLAAVLDERPTEHEHFGCFDLGLGWGKITYTLWTTDGHDGGSYQEFIEGPGEIIGYTFDGHWRDQMLSMINDGISEGMEIAEDDGKEVEVANIKIMVDGERLDPKEVLANEE